MSLWRLLLVDAQCLPVIFEGFRRLFCTAKQEFFCLPATSTLGVPSSRPTPNSLARLGKWENEPGSAWNNCLTQEIMPSKCWNYTVPPYRNRSCTVSYAQGV